MLPRPGRACPGRAVFGSKQRSTETSSAEAKSGRKTPDSGCPNTPPRGQAAWRAEKAQLQNAQARPYAQACKRGPTRKRTSEARRASVPARPGATSLAFFEAALFTDHRGACPRGVVFEDQKTPEKTLLRPGRACPGRAVFGPKQRSTEASSAVPNSWRKRLDSGCANRPPRGQAAWWASRGGLSNPARPRPDSPAPAT